MPHLDEKVTARMIISETIRAMGENPDEQLIGELTVFDAVAAKVRAALPTTAPKVTECATVGCSQAATVRFERLGVGSDYCYGCYMRMQAIHAVQEAGQ